ncbi:ABC transporter ATP-binding protein [Streptomyces sp. SID8111]|uniref:ABC transporter ATP-binding protein n=1 Tax=Streptomyces sp. SID8111 TaxID=2706100 RepID=UPI0013C07C15|nr:ABC transporter ATP-binding protein [Streptomyces sp. SID8111]NEC26410.1 ABC transporter ATP-binding protein [Streptomyces sp. SID8111]
MTDPTATGTRAPGGEGAGAAAALAVEDVTLSAGARRLIRGVSLTARPGETIGLVGPNGSGKSTLLRAVYRVLRPDSGRVRVDGADAWSLPVRRLARTVAAVVQDAGADFDLAVREVVAMGRTPHKRLLDGDTAEDAALIGDALAAVGARHLADRPFDRLSGGERQRVLIARALAQRPALLVLDEPTNHLDIRHQLDILGALRRLPATVLLALHDLNLAAYYCDRLHVLCDGEVVASGTPAEVLTPGLLAEVYGVAADVGVHPGTGAPHVTFLPGRAPSGASAPERA